MTYRLRLPYRMKQLHLVFNVVKLTLAPDDLITGRTTEDHLLPIVIDGEAEWEVEEILNSRWHWRRFVTNFIWPYLHQFSIDSHGLNGYGKPLKRPFNRY